MYSSGDYFESVFFIVFPYEGTGWSGGNMSPRLLVNRSRLSLPRKSGLVKPSIHINHICLGGYIHVHGAHFECHDILVLGKIPIKWKQTEGGLSSLQAKSDHMISG